MWVTIYINKRPRPEVDGVPKFRPWMRDDIDDWSYLLTIFTHFFFWPRFALAWFSAWLAMFGSAIGAVGHDFSKQPSALRRWIMTNGTAIGCRGGMLAYGVIWI
jgi:hypothetical protein